MPKKTTIQKHNKQKGAKTVDSFIDCSPIDCAGPCFLNFLNFILSFDSALLLPLWDASFRHCIAGGLVVTNWIIFSRRAIEETVLRIYVRHHRNMNC